MKTFYQSSDCAFFKFELVVRWISGRIGRCCSEQHEHSAKVSKMTVLALEWNNIEMKIHLKWAQKFKEICLKINTQPCGWARILGYADTGGRVRVTVRKFENPQTIFFTCIISYKRCITPHIGVMLMPNCIIKSL